MVGSDAPVPWKPRYTLTPGIATGLMAIAEARAATDRLPIPSAVLEACRRLTRLRSTHFSTRIEGNRLSLAETETAILSDARQLRFYGRERDVREVRNYWRALALVEQWAARAAPLTEDVVRRLHAQVQQGPRARPTPYRDGQNVLSDAGTGRVVYMPPEAADVPALMAGLVAWVRRSEREALPAPLVAGLLHYQLVTIHPFFDGNGRTARLLSTFWLERAGYGVQGLVSVEECHAADLPAYYRALAVHPHHNYYDGRNEADLTPWLEYFVRTLAVALSTAREEALRLSVTGSAVEGAELAALERRARVVVGLFAGREVLTTAQMAAALGLSPRMVRVLVGPWVEAGWLVPTTSARRSRAYRLAERYRQVIGNPTAIRPTSQSAAAPPPPR